MALRVNSEQTTRINLTHVANFPGMLLVSNASDYMGYFGNTLEQFILSTRISFQYLFCNILTILTESTSKHSLFGKHPTSMWITL